MFDARWTFEVRPLLDDVSCVENIRPAIDYQRPTWIFWDVGLTFVYPSAGLVEEALRPKFGPLDRTSAEVLAALVTAAEARHLPWPPGISGDERVARAWAGLLGLPVSKAAPVLASCLRRTDLYREIDASAPSVLDALKRCGVRLGVISNSDGTLVDELNHFGLLDRFDVVIDSGRVGVQKPDREIFRIALREACTEPGDAWHIGDGVVNDYLGAATAGLAPVLLDRYDRLGRSFPAYRITRLSQVLALKPFRGASDRAAASLAPSQASDRPVAIITDTDRDR